MKVVAGLGNPGRRYEGSRHNAGFAVVDELANRWRIDVSQYDRNFEGQIGEGSIGGEPVKLLKPSTLMNLSGRSVGALVRFYKLAISDVLVVCDDMDLPVGSIRLRRDGSAGGQKGLIDVIRNLGSEEIARLRLGIGRVHKSAAVEFVLGRFEPHEREDAAFAIRKAADAAECWIQRGIDAAMNEFNRRKADDRPASGPSAGPDKQGEPS